MSETHFDAEVMLNRILTNNAFFAPNEIKKLDQSQRDALIQTAEQKLNQLPDSELSKPSARKKATEGFYSNREVLTYTIVTAKIPRT